MKLYLALLLLIVGQIAANDSWEAYKAKHGKKYEKQDAERRALFEKTDAQIKAHNGRFDQGLETYRMDHNKFSDMNEKERARATGLRKVKPYEARLNRYKPNRRALPASLDYRTSKCMAPIKNQGKCGCCWAFSIIAPIEFRKCKKTGTLVTLSEQQVLDCTYASSYNGCNGGSNGAAYTYLYKAGGAQKSSDYPFTSGTTGKSNTCKFVNSKAYAKLANTGTLISSNETLIQQALVTYGPLSHYYYVSSKFYSYKSGVFSDSTCLTTLANMNHGMTIVGYGVSGTTPYWIVRNQWGTGWGQAGYVFILRGKNTCGIATYVISPTVV